MSLPYCLRVCLKREIRKFEWILRQFKEETRRLSSAKSSLVTQKWRSDAEIADYGIFETHSNTS